MTYNASNPKSLTLSGKHFSSLLAVGVERVSETGFVSGPPDF